MAQKVNFPALLLIAAGLVFSFGNKLPIPDSGWWSRVVPVPAVKLEGSTLLLVHEKTKPTVDQVLAVRSAAQFAQDNKFAGYLDVDQDDPWVSPLLSIVLEKHKLVPPFIAAAEVKDGAIGTIGRVRPWKSGLEDILK